MHSSSQLTHASCFHNSRPFHRTSPSPSTAIRPLQYFYSNSFTGPLPTELGQLTVMTSGFLFGSNQLCGDDVPTQVQALSGRVTSYWQVTTGNSFGTLCGWQDYMADEDDEPEPAQKRPAAKVAKRPAATAAKAVDSEDEEEDEGEDEENDDEEDEPEPAKKACS